ncbi:insulinase family protein [Prochlorococcus marinus XMU1414]|uniref:Insulinase family protein n=1 Tax=Prochlorococcus marinus XMU1424 TaxID=2774497 RepID=A0A9D9FZM6_PROMR|nr:pitrilysin family protein [Prochlorococcus marinus]MBO8228052.1 insulinase family protein [Prochlorococcus marinus XMU1414]MBW3045556.1 peptidase M16 [Prochlorococcus marinus str. MU1414]MCR8532167.1 insulinase family protein [Prochlorococcus marinus XMU1420]MCR8535694.1 insulinase family protein [Prochlorococcus marinus XMU1424]
MNVGAVNYYTHSSKTRCVFVDNKELPLLSIDIWCKAGSSFEDVDKNGTAHFLEHMIFKGSNKIMPGEFDHKIESLGGLSNASTGYDDVHYHVLVPPSNFKESLALLTNIVVAPNFNPDEFIKEKGVVIDEIKQQNDQPEERLFNYFLKRVWLSPNYANSILGTEHSIKNLEINDLVKFHSKHYTTEKVCIAIAGNLSEEIYKIFEKSDLSGLTESPNLINQKNKPSLKIRNGRESVKFDNLEFSRIFMAWFIPNLNDQKNIIGLEILASILSVGRNSRLVKILKEDSNLVESVYVDVNAGELGGLFIIEASCESKDIDLVEKLINKTLYEITNCKAFALNEIKKAINIVKSNYIFNLETSTQLSSFFGNELLWGRKSSINNLESHLKYWNDLANFKKITEYIRGEKFTLVAYPGKC